MPEGRKFHLIFTATELSPLRRRTPNFCLRIQENGLSDVQNKTERCARPPGIIGTITKRLPYELVGIAVEALVEIASELLHNLAYTPISAALGKAKIKVKKIGCTHEVTVFN